MRRQGVFNVPSMATIVICDSCEKIVQAKIDATLMDERNSLELLRADPRAWDRVSFAAGQSEERGTYDENEIHRRRILLALQYDRRDTDIELIRHLFTNEVIAAENDSFQGFGDAFTLAALLLASLRDPTDVPLFARAKFANFDTACGFPLEFMFIAGGDETGRILRDSSPAIWDKLSEHFLNSDNAPENLDEWWTSINKDYPNAKQDEDLLSLYERSLAFDEPEEARQYFDQWALEEPESESKRSQLKYEYKRLGDFKSAAVVASSQLKTAVKAWDRTKGGGQKAGPKGGGQAPLLGNWGDLVGWAPRFSGLH